MDKKRYKEVHDANISYHRLEAKYYDMIHSEVFNVDEQKRLLSVLEKIDGLIRDNKRRALDFGAGTGNLTGKLLRIGYNVTAVDISQEMCEILNHRYKEFVDQNQLRVIQSTVEEMEFDREEFDLITCYSVLHHLPDYLTTIRNLGCFLKKGGIMYLDHEESPYFWNENEQLINRIFTKLNRLMNIYMNRLYLKLLEIDDSVLSLDFSMSDYWINKSHHLDHKKIEQSFVEDNYEYVVRKDFHIKKSKFFNPFFVICKKTQKPDMSYWIAKK